MPRGRLYEKDCQLKLSGHETFPLRYGWLKKAFDGGGGTEEGEENGRSVFLADNAIARFGVGRNMVASMRHWATAVGGDRRRRMQDHAILVSSCSDEGGLDPLHGRSGLGMVCAHWTLSGNPRNTTWYWAFSHYPALTFDRDTLVRGIEKLVREHPGTRASLSTIRNDVACFVRSYVGQPPSAKTGHEDSLESPLAELGPSPTDRQAGRLPVRSRTANPRSAQEWSLLPCMNFGRVGLPFGRFRLHGLFHFEALGP